MKTDKPIKEVDSKIEIYDNGKFRDLRVKDIQGLIKKARAEVIEEFCERIKQIEIWDCSPDEFLDKMNKIAKQLGEEE